MSHFSTWTSRDPAIREVQGLLGDCEKRGVDADIQERLKRILTLSEVRHLVYELTYAFNNKTYRNLERKKNPAYMVRLVECRISISNVVGSKLRLLCSSGLRVGHMRSEGRGFEYWMWVINSVLL